MVAKGKGPTRKKVAKKTPGPRPHSRECSFCGKHQRNTPLMVMSQKTNATICAYCAMNVVEQTMGHMVNVSSAFSQVVASKPEWFSQDENTGAISFVDPEKELDKIVEENNAEGE